MIYVADTLSFGSQHEQFNISFLNLLRAGNAEEKILFWGTASANNSLKKRLNGIEFENIEAYDKRGGIKEFIRAFDQFWTLRRLIKQANITRPSYIYILLAHPLAHFLFKIFYRNKENVRIVLHGELESIKFNKHFVNKIWGFFLKSALLKKSNGQEYIILGQSVYHNLLSILPRFASQPCIILDHPYPFSVSQPTRSVALNLVFSCLGVASLQKNTHYFFRLAEIVAGKPSKRPAKFNVCGKVFRNMSPFLNKHVNHKEVDKTLSREQVNELLTESHFAVFYYDNINYSLCPSGAFWDAINAELPLLYVRNDYFDHYSRVAGKIGLAFDSPDLLNEYIVRLSQQGMSDGEYSGYVSQIRFLKYEYMKEENLIRQLQK